MQKGVETLNAMTSIHDDSAARSEPAIKIVVEAESFI